MTRLAERYRLEFQEDWLALIAHLDLQEGFSFALLTVPETEVAQLCLHTLRQRFASSAKLPVEIACTEPAQVVGLARTLVNLEAGKTPATVFVHAVVSDTHATYAEWRAAWLDGIGRLNQVRNLLQAQMQGALVLVGAPWVKPLVREVAPDLYSIRALVVDLTPTLESGSHPARLDAVEDGLEDAPDPELALSAAARLRGLPGRELELAAMLGRAAKGLAARFGWPEAEAAAAEAVALAEHSAGESSLLVGLLDVQRYVLVRLGRYAEAKPLAERALRIAESVYGPDHSNVALLANNLGNLHQSLGDLPAAREYTERALRIDEALYGPDHPSVAVDANNLGQIYMALGDLRLAKTYTERALRIGEAVYGPDHPAIAIRANNLGAILQAGGDLRAALGYTERAFRIQEAAYGANHPTVAVLANNLGQIHQALGDLRAAREHTERALRIHEAVYGTNHPDVATDANNLGMIHQDLGDIPTARIYLNRALSIYTATLGPDHPRTRDAAGNLAALDGK